MYTCICNQMDEKAYGKDHDTACNSSSKDLLNVDFYIIFSMLLTAFTSLTP